MVQAIVYTSNTGNTEKYAKLLGHQLDLPVCELTKAEFSLEKRTKIIFLGWVMADGIQGYQEATRYFEVSMVCAVGLSPNNDRETEMRQKNGLPENLPLLILQGGFFPKKLKGIHKLLMMVMAKSTVKQLTAKGTLSEEERDFLELLKNGGSRVRLENVKGVIQWYETESQREYDCSNADER